MNVTELIGRRAALIVGHPGHELRVHGWLEIARPDVFVLTEGSGSKGSPRINSTLKVLNRVGSRPTEIFGAFSDRQLYATLMNHRFDPIVKLVDDLVAQLRSSEIDYVVTDAYEGFSVTHDLCRIVTAVATDSCASPAFLNIK